MIKKSYSQLTKDELYSIAKLRQEVFIVEQKSIYLDLDNLDQYATHFLLKDSSKLFAYARYRVLSDEHKVKIERFVLDKQSRGRGQGKYLFESMLNDILVTYPDHVIALSSQISACQFYQKLGFKETGEPYDDGGIAHIDMQYQV